MKKLTSGITAKLSFVLASLLMSFLSFAQDKQIDVNINKGSDSSGNFMASPWVWVVGGAVFIIILVAIMKGNSNK